MINATLGRLAAGEDLPMEAMDEAMDAVFRGECDEGQIAVLLTSLRTKGETVAELAGTVAALRRHTTPIRTRRAGAVDTCGTGGDGSRTFNISTAAALVAAAAGAPVAKHGNRGITSRSGSADVLAALGVNVEADIHTVEACLDELGICFGFAPLLYHAMKQVAPVRRKLGVPTIFNLVGPLMNAAGAPYQLLGVGRPELLGQMAGALALLGIERAAVVSGEDGLDEVTLSAATNVILVEKGRTRPLTWTPEDFDLPRATRETMLVDGPEESAALIRRILDGETGPPRDIVVANAGAALWVARQVETPAEGARRAAQAIDEGTARQLLARLSERSHR